MKLAILIPAYNEEKNILGVLQKIPSKFQGIDQSKVFVLDDASTDKTVEFAKSYQNDSFGLEVFTSQNHLGLAKNFDRGIELALQWHADIIVNIDADGQYLGNEISLLIKPILENNADIVFGDRQVKNLNFMPPAKRYGNLFGSFFIRKLTGCQIQDASTGFRAWSRFAAQKIRIQSQHTYTHETLIQAHYQNLRLQEVLITFLPRHEGQSSRLIKSVLKHIIKSFKGILRSWWKWRSYPTSQQPEINP